MSLLKTKESRELSEALGNPMLRDAFLAQLTEEILDIQADIQTPLGFIRMQMAGDPDVNSAITPETLENYLSRSLARAHKLLDNLGNPMYSPSIHSDV